MSLTWLGTGKGGGLEYTSSLLGSILQSLCDQHSWRTHHLRPWVTASATRTKTCKWNCGRTENWLHGGTAFEKGELTDSSEPTLPQLPSPACEFLSLSLVLQHPHLLPGVVKEAKTPVAHLFAVLLFRTVVAGEQMKTHRAEAGTNILMLSGKEEHQEMKCKCYCWLLKYSKPPPGWFPDCDRKDDFSLRLWLSPVLCDSQHCSVESDQVRLSNSF